MFGTTLAVLGPDGVSSDFSASNGSSFQVGVSADSYTDLYAWQFDLNWDPTILSLNSITEGNALTSAGSTFFIPGTIDNSGGSATFNADSLVGPGPGVNGTNQGLAYFDFSAIGTGQTSVTLGNLILLDSNFNDIEETSEAATVSVEGAVTAIPEPGYSWFLFATALALATLLYRRRTNPEKSCEARGGGRAVKA